MRSYHIETSILFGVLREEPYRGTQEEQIRISDGMLMTSFACLLAKKMLMSFFTFSNSRHPNIKLSFEKKKDNKTVF